jgi:hypothetical protein
LVYVGGKLVVKKLGTANAAEIEALVKLDAQNIIARGDGNALVATSRAVVNGKLTQNYENIRLYPDNRADIIGAARVDKIVNRSEDGAKFQITDADAYISKLKDAYGGTMNPITEQRIRSYIVNPDGSPRWLSQIDGMPGSHAEIQSFNEAVNLLQAAGKPIDYKNITIATYKTSEPRELEAFPACGNCCGILPCGVNLITGRTNP